MSGCGRFRSLPWPLDVLLGMPGGQADITAQSRIIQGLVAGIGIIGGGAILKGEGGVHGTATAASIWTTGALGASVAQERFALAIVLAALNLFALRVLMPLKAKAAKNGDGNEPDVSRDTDL